MIRIHATKKLLAKLPVDQQGLLPTGAKHLQLAGNTDSLLSGWHANILSLQDRDCILLVHDHTRFPVFIPLVDKEALAALDWHFQDILMNTLLKAGASQAQLDSSAAQLSRLYFDNDCDRSVQGTMNQMKNDLETRLWYDSADVAELLPYSTSLWLADRPCTVKGKKGCVWPIKAMFALLDGEQ
ncbi:hypothetical protein [Microbulbifer sp. SAOS-129_SWC]|uniref:DUF6933 domain-containing protein n=1 Tax=Microbulbifer sp. SAOS-129_SWC TaxID=3145235 RepID=UPI003217138B